VNIEGYQIFPVYCFEDWALEMVPNPVKALIFLYPIKKEKETPK